MLAFKTGTGTVTGLCFTPDGRGLVTGSGAGVTLWDLTGTPTVRRQFGEGSYFTCPVAVSPCGRFLASGGDSLHVFDLTDEQREPVVLPGSAETVAFAPDGTEFTIPGLTPRRWAVPSWDAIRAESVAKRPNRSEIFTGALAYTPDGKGLGVSLGVLAEDGSRYHPVVVLFDRATGARTKTLAGTFRYAYPTQIAFSPDGSVVAGNFGPVLGVVSVTDGTEVACIKVGTKHITALAFTPDGSKLVAVSNDTRIRVYDARTWTETTGYEWKVGKLRSVAVAPDGLRMAAGSGTGKVVIWDVDG